MSSKFNYEIIGKVIPERVHFSITVTPVTIKVPDLKYDIEISLSIQLSMISVKISSNNEIKDYATIRNIVRDFIRLYTDSFGYLHGYAYDVEITSFSGINNIPHIIYGVNITELENDFSNRPLQNFDDICKLMYDGNNNELRLALTDLRLSIQYPTDTGMYCYRAVESLMQFFNQGDKEKAWSDFRNNLNISKLYLQSIMDKSWPSRHGKPIPISHDERVDLMKRAWQVVDRFIIYAKNNNQALDETAYPELTS